MNLECPYCNASATSSENRKTIVRVGQFYRRCDNSFQQRFYCKSCRKSFSEAKFDFYYRQRKRKVNRDVFLGLVSGESQRRLSYLLQINRKTVVRKFQLLGLLSYYALKQKRLEFPPSTEIEFDDLETFEHSKLKPISVTMAVESRSRRILGFRVSIMPAKGLLVKRSLEKYGRRRDDRKYNRQALFKEIRDFVVPQAIIKSDENPHYGPDVKSYFPGCTHQAYKGRRGCVVGQGELKAGGFDPLFSLNHTLAMCRANINRLFRRTWNTTKKMENLSLHLALYAFFHNEVLIVPKERVVSSI